MTADPNDPCLACEIVAGRVRPPGGVLLRDGPFVYHGFAGESPVKGWVVLTAVRHVRGVYDFDGAEAAALGPAVARVVRAQKAALGADHAYAMAFGDALHHAHVHVVPRYPDTPTHLRGARVMLASLVDARPHEEIEAAAHALAEALRTGG